MANLLPVEEELSNEGQDDIPYSYYLLFSDGVDTMNSLPGIVSYSLLVYDKSELISVLLSSYNIYTRLLQIREQIFPFILSHIKLNRIIVIS